MFHFEELDEATREHMLDEVERDIADGKLYMSKNFSASAKGAYPDLLRKAVREGTEQSLTQALRYAGFWSFIKGRSGFGSPRPLRPMRPLKSGPSGFGSAGSTLDEINNAAATFAEGEFNVYYMRGLCLKLIAEGQGQAEVYRAKAVDEPRAGGKVHAGQIVSCADHLEALRARKGGVSTLGLPRGVNSGLSLRRVRQDADATHG